MQMLYRCCSSKGGAASSARVSPSLSLLLGVFGCVLVAVCLLSTPAHAATSIVSAPTTTGRNPAAVAHLGESIPITMYLRLKRQITTSFLFGADDIQLQVDEGGVMENKDGDVVVDKDGGDDGGRENTGVTAIPDELDLAELQLPSVGATTGKHPNQLVRNLPPQFSPRFGISRTVALVANGTLRAAAASLTADPQLQQSDLAVRFSVGRGLQKESTWLPLASRHKFVDLLTETLLRRLDEAQEGAARVQQAAINAKAMEDAAENNNNNNNGKGEPEVHYLSKVTFFFGYKTGELQRMTSFSIDAAYSTVPRPAIELQYVWSEHRPYNPNRALVFCSAAALAVAMIMVVVVFHPSSRSMLIFSQRMVAVREHE